MNNWCCDKLHLITSKKGGKHSHLTRSLLCKKRWYVDMKTIGGGMLPPPPPWPRPGPIAPITIRFNTKAAKMIGEGRGRALSPPHAAPFNLFFVSLRTILIVPKWKGGLYLTTPPTSKLGVSVSFLWSLQIIFIADSDFSRKSSKPMWNVILFYSYRWDSPFFCCTENE